MRLGKWMAIGGLVLPLAEIAAVILAAILIGWAAALGLIVASSLAGLLLLRRHGSGWGARIRAAAAERGPEGAAEAILSGDDAAVALAGLLMLLPGFITSLAAVALFFPKARQWLGATIRRAAAPAAAPTGAAGVVDLAPGDWRHVGDPVGETPRGPREIRGR